MPEVGTMDQDEREELAALRDEVAGMRNDQERRGRGWSTFVTLLVFAALLVGGIWAWQKSQDDAKRDAEDRFDCIVSSPNPDLCD